MKNVLITGASSGIGLELAKQYVQKGYNTYVCARNITTLNELYLEHSSHLNVYSLDVTQKNDVQKYVSSLPNIDIAILNAGTCEYVDLDTFNSELFERVFSVNIMGVVHCIEHLLPKMPPHSQIVFVSSLARQLPFTRAQAYGSSKAALHYLARSLEVDLHDRGILVQTVSPGFVKTPLTDKNDFPMPFLITPERAAKEIISGINKRKNDISFPKRLSWTLKFMALLPQSWQVAISRKIRNAS